ncbi:hypothetical protein AU254_19960 [Yersinia pestis]|nr:hypothetical protein AU254_19960 [Yersinia pestis]
MTRPPQLIERVLALPYNMFNSHLPTVAISLLTFVVLYGVKWLRPNWPAPLLAIVIATFVSWAANMQQLVLMWLAVLRGVTHSTLA